MPKTAKTKKSIEPIITKDPEYVWIIIAIHGSISAEWTLESGRGSSSNIWTLEEALSRLVEGGYVIDLSVIKEYYLAWIYNAPMSTGEIEGRYIRRVFVSSNQCPEEPESELFTCDFNRFCSLIGQMKETWDGTAEPYDSVSARYEAIYWGSRGARIGQRQKDTLVWSDGSEQPILPLPQE
jgi:hypothetical protein